MAELDPRIVGGILTPLDIRHANDASAQSQAQTRGLDLGNTAEQQKIDITKRAINARRIYDDLVAKNTGPGGSSAQPAVPAAKTPAPALGADDANTDDPGSPGLPGDSYPTAAPPQSAEDQASAAPLPDEGKEAKPAALPGETPPPAPAPGSGRVYTNWDAVHNGMRVAGYGTEALEADAELQKALGLGLKNHTSQLENEQKMAELMGNAAESITRVDPNADPATQQLQKAQFQATAMVALQSGLKQGWIPAQQEQALAQQVQQGWSPQLQQQIEALAARAKNHAENLRAHLEEEKAPQQAILTGTTIAENRGKIDKADSEQMGRDVAGVPPTQVALDNFFSGYRDKPRLQNSMRATYENPDLSIQQKLDRFAEMGLSDQQRTVRDAKADALDARVSQYAETNEYKRIAADQRQEMIDLHRYQAEHDKVADRQQTARDDAQLNRLQASERALYAKRSRLGAQLTNAGIPGTEFQYIQANGTTKPSAMMHGAGTKKIDPKEVSAAVSDMKAQYDAATEQLKEIVNQKYDITKDSGTKSRDQALHEVEFGKDKPAAATPSATPAPSATPVTAKPAAPKTVQAAGQAIDVPPEISKGLQVGVPRKVNSPSGPITVVRKADGKVYRQ